MMMQALKPGLGEEYLAPPHKGMGRQASWRR